MANNNHGYVSTMYCACTDVGALNAVGVYTKGDLDNGVAVKLTKMAQDSTNTATGFQFEVEPATSSDKDGIWVVNTPEVGSDLDMQLHDDPRYFYNKSGRPMSIKKLVSGVDYLELDANCFTNGLPNGTGSEDFATIGASGKWTKAAEAGSGAHLEFVAKHSVHIGWEDVPTVIMRYVEAKA